MEININLYLYPQFSFQMSLLPFLFFHVLLEFFGAPVRNVLFYGK